jgi:glutamine synthetase type III
MNFLITSLGVSAAMSTVTATTSFVNTVSSVSTKIMDSTDTGIDNIRALIKETDIKNDVKIIKMVISEIDIENSTDVVKVCIENVNESLKEIKEEMDSIDYRVKHNDNLMVDPMGMRSYGFTNSHKRLKAKIKLLNKRFNQLKTYI